jgi:hypothetical protein
MIGFGTALLFGTCCTLAAETSGDVCPVKIEVVKSGKFYTNRFNGHYKTSANFLERDLRGGCYNDANPSKVTSVTLRIAPGAPPQAVNWLYQLLERNGWPKSKLKVDP